MKKLIPVILFSLLLPVFVVFAQTPAYKDMTYVSGFAPATSMEFAPDGRIFVAERGGKVRVIKNGQLLPTPFLTVSVALNGERGLSGITLDPNFRTNGYVYIYYTRANEPIKNRLSRFTVSATNPDVADPNSEKILIDDIGSDSGIHNGGALHFGKDGKLYVAVGDGGSFRANAQILTNLSGKILRINPDGTIPNDNPFIGYSLPGVRTEIWAFGFRNPFTFAVDPVSGKIYVNDVGETTWEEINILQRDGNYTWPRCEGPQNTGVGECADSDFQYPLYAYNHNKKGASITGAAFYKGDYYFGDMVLKVIRKMNSNNAVSDFISTSELPVDIDAGPDGNLYYLGYGGKVMKIVAQDTPINGLCAVTVVNICHSGTFTDLPDSATHALWSCVGSSGGTTASCSVPLSSNKLPTATITTPVVNAKYNAGQTISFSGTGTDPEDGTLPASAFSWSVVFHHNTHTHPFLGPITGKTGDSFVVPNTGELADDVWYRIYLTVTDSKGAKSEVYRDVYPNVVTLTFRTNPAGKNVTVDGQPQTTPYVVKSVVGMKRIISVDSQDFFEWSNNGAREQTITTPTTDTAYTASFSAPRPTSVVMQPYYGSGDLSIHMQKEVDDRIGGNMANATTKSLWYTRGSNTAAWEQNPFTFLRGNGIGIDLNGQSPWNSLGQYARSGTLISPRHIIFAKHFRLSAGTTVVFVDSTNRIVERTIEKVELAPDPLDIGVGLLNKDVPENIPFYPIISRSIWQQYLGNVGTNVDIPIIYLDLEDKIGVHVIKANALYSNSANLSHVKGTGKRAEFDEPIVLGDSGNPAFAIIGGQPVLLFTHFDFPFGPNFATHFDLINGLMTKLGGGYQLSTLDLSRFDTSVPKFTLTVSKPIGGTVIAAGGINCGTNCSAQYNKDTEVSLAADKATGYVFSGWSGDCTGTGLCTVKMDKAKTVTANFTVANTAPIAQNATFTFSGTSTTVALSASDAQNDSLTYTLSTLSTPKGTLTKVNETTYTYTLKTPLPTTSFTETFTFTASDGRLASNNATITLQYTVTAPPKYNLTVSKTGQGTIQGTGISCGVDCAEQINAGSVISLLAIPASGYTFSRWTGDCTSTSISCSVTLDKPKTVNAIFVLALNLDADGDGILLPLDKCPNTLPAVRNQVNRAGCVRPKLTKFTTKPVVEDDISAVPNVELGINNVGKIKFNTPVALTRENAVIDIDANVIIEQDKVEIKSSVIPELNRPATITLYNIDEKNPRILRDGVVCSEPQCKIESFSNGTLVFTVSGFSLYTVEETPVTATSTPNVEEKPKRRGGGGGGGGGGAPKSATSNEELIAQLTAQLNMLIAELNRLTGGSMLTSDLTQGMRGAEVTKLQNKLTAKGFPVSSSGYYGTQTTTAVKKFQTSKGITPTGNVGPLTRAQLNK